MNTSEPLIATPSSSAPSEAAKRLLPWLVAVAFFMESLDTTILNTAVPAISAALHVAPLSMKAVLASYTLSLAVFIPISGWMADRFGTRRVFASAIGLFTLGSFLCGISSDIHLLVACRILQGCGGAMMVPVGRLTLVRTFAKSDLLRMMSFVSIPALVAPMLGPIAGGLIVGYLHWRFIFFLNIPIGLAGLILVYLHLPDYREKKPHALDVVGLILFGTGIALLSYVLEIFGEHSLSSIGDVRTAGAVRRLAGGIRSPCHAALHSLCSSSNCSASARSAPPWRQLLYPPGHRRRPVSAAAALSGGSGLHSDRVGPAGHAPGHCRHEHEDDHAAASEAHRLSRRAHFQHPDSRHSSDDVRHHRSANTPVWVILLLAFIYGGFTSLQYTSMNTLVYADIKEQDTSEASSIASTMQQMSISFGVAAAGLATALFVPSVHSNPRTDDCRNT